MPGQITDYRLIGNDIVDLTHPDAWDIHPRFAEKICTRAENKMLEIYPYKSHQWIRQLWKFWTIKEAAYKAVKRFNPSTKFRWKDFDGAIVPGKVYCPYGIILSVDTGIRDASSEIQSSTNAFIHSVVYYPRIPDFATYKQIDVVSSGKRNLSVEIRKSFAMYISKKFNFNSETVQWAKHTSGAPVCILNDNVLPFHISFSHHGTFLGYAFVVSDCCFPI